MSLGEREDELLDTLEAVIDADLPYVLVGGWAIAAFNQRFTTDVDVVIPAQSVDDADDLIGGLRREDLSSRVQLHGDRHQVERVFRAIQRRTSSFSNCFSHVDPATAETWLQAHAVWWNHA